MKYSQPLPTEPEGKPFWRVEIAYSNHTTQDIRCYNDALPDRAEEFHMKKPNHIKIITPELIDRYTHYLREQEKSTATIQKYVHDLTALCGYLSGAPLTKTVLIGWKEHLTTEYAASSVNTILAALNGLLDFCGWAELKVKPLKIQKSIFCDEGKELTREEYFRLIHAAEQEGNQRLSLAIQTICATGIRVSELKFITAGAVFVTKTGKPLDRSNIWRDMKALCESAGMEAGKIFLHNLRRLFARTYYSIEKDLSRLADILGHSNINTTRIYTMESGVVHARQMDRMGLTAT